MVKRKGMYVLEKKMDALITMIKHRVMKKINRKNPV